MDMDKRDIGSRQVRCIPGDFKTRSEGDQE